MKYCPKCNRTYDDKELNFCLDDGTSLETALSDVTEKITVDREALQFNLQADDENKTEVLPLAHATQSTPANKTSQIEKSGFSPLVVGFLVALLLFITVGFLGFVAFTFIGQSETASANSNNGVRDGKTPEARSDNAVSELKDEVDKLKDEIANRKSNTSKPESDKPQDAPIIEDDSEKFLAKVHSPNDGFLALRNIPNHKTGVKVVEIPHGTRIQLFGCQSRRIKVSGRMGRWCKSYYKDRSGWIFDAFVIR